MDYKNLFEKFNEGGKLLLPDATVTFDAIPWSKHPTFEGVELPYEAGIISIFPIGVPHEVIAGGDGLCLFAKFMPAFANSSVWLYLFRIAEWHECLRGHRGILGDNSRRIFIS